MNKSITTMQQANKHRRAGHPLYCALPNNPRVKVLSIGYAQSAFHVTVEGSEEPVKTLSVWAEIPHETPSIGLFEPIDEEEKSKKTYPQCREKVIHPLHGEAEVVLVDTGYANGRGWIHCNFGNSGGFACYADEVTRIETSEEEEDVKR